MRALWFYCIQVRASNSLFLARIDCLGKLLQAALAAGVDEDFAIAEVSEAETVACHKFTFFPVEEGGGLDDLLLFAKTASETSMLSARSLTILTIFRQAKMHQFNKGSLF